MKQILQNLKSGATELLNVPAPLTRPGHLLIATRRSLISAGTERMLVEFGQANLLAKAKAQPDKVRQVLDKLRTDGLLPTLEAVFARLDQPLPLGYCNAGVVLAVGEGITGFAVGDHVISNGPHAEVVCVPQNLCARIPEGVSDDEAAFTVLAAVALQGIRLAEPTLGENVAVIGLGLVGLMTVQMLVANGCRVLGVDFDPGKLALARQFGAQTVDLGAGGDPVQAGLAFSHSNGMDAVLITASTKSNDPVHQAAQMSRKRGRIVLVGVTGLELSRADFYEKELTFQVSCSYGPGRYDPAYEQQGRDYPYGFVRWTEQRNFQAVLNLMADKRLDIEPLISTRVPQAEAPTAYQRLTEDHSLLGVLLTYPEQSVDLSRTVGCQPSAISRQPSAISHQHPPSNIHHPAACILDPVIGMIGAGNFASLVLLPALKKTPALLKTIASAGGTSAALAARKFGFQEATTDYRALLDDPDINTLFIATRHNLHARLVIEALQAGKHVFVEKPLALTRAELQDIASAYQNARIPETEPQDGHPTTNSQLSTLNPQLSLMVGYNRRFSPLAVKMRALLQARSQPVSVIYTVNAGEIPPGHWVHDPHAGGGRIIGEGCHFVDFLRYLVASPIVGVEAQMMGAASGIVVREDKMTIQLAFEDGSMGTVHYLANGSKSYPKERVEVFYQGRVLVLNNFKTLRGYGWPGFRRMGLFRQDKGHQAEIAAFIERVMAGGPPLIPWTELAEVSLATFTAVERAAQPATDLV
jgi:predicted dehydrogenase/threonine dehydrogenase-like Zn-dependent dehydrogenase